MSVRELLKEKVDAVAADRGLVDNKAFGYWFLEEMEDHSPEEAESIVVDGPWDGGRDGVAWDEEQGQLTIYQFKYSDKLAYVLKGFADLETGLTNELADIQEARGLDRPPSVSDIRRVRLVIVSLSSDRDRLETEVKSRRRNLKSWRTRKNHAFEVELENVDLRFFMQAFDRLFGVDAELEFLDAPVSLERGEKKVHLGLLDLRSLVEHIGDESLIYFNIRSFLGVRKGSINEAIRTTVATPDLRDDFWLYNNGIVALCTEMRRSRTGTAWRAKTLTIVNGAQTVNTVGRFLKSSAIAATDPVPVVAKIIEVDEDDLDLARAITKTSNSQTPTSNRELRAVDPLHQSLRTWFEERGWSYTFRRGDGHEAGLERTTMKEVAQAYLAWGGKPHISFARAGRIFADDSLYEEAFDPDAVMSLRTAGDEAAVASYVDRRLLPVSTLHAVASLIKSRGDGLDRKWRSLAYHLVWVVGRALADKDPRKVLPVIDLALADSGEDLLDGLVEFAMTTKLDIPRALKSSEFADAMEAAFWGLPRITTAMERMRHAADEGRRDQINP